VALLNREFNADRAAGMWTDIAFPDHALDVCADLARRNGPKLGVRTLDSRTSPAHWK
jgi:hypothetical protein